MPVLLRTGFTCATGGFIEALLFERNFSWGRPAVSEFFFIGLVGIFDELEAAAMRPFVGGLSFDGVGLAEGGGGTS